MIPLEKEKITIIVAKTRRKSHRKRSVAALHDLVVTSELLSHASRGLVVPSELLGHASRGNSGIFVTHHANSLS